MKFKNKEELDNYLADKTREIEERLESELVEEKGMTDVALFAILEGHNRGFGCLQYLSSHGQS